MAGRLDGKRAIVIGAGSSGPGWGNGKAAAVLFAREGARVLCVDVNAEAAAETVGLIEAEGGTARAFTADVTDGDQVRALVDDCLESWGGVDVLHFNVGIVGLGGPVEASEETWRRVMDVNLTSLFLSCKHVLPVMERQFEETGRGGALLAISSVAGIRDIGVPYVAYNASKGAIIPFMRSVALQYARKGIRANCILPGLMNTPMIREPLKNSYGEGDGNIDRMIEIRNAQCPTGQMGDAWDVAYAALYLASDEARYVTATELLVDGGITAKCV